MLTRQPGNGIVRNQKSVISGFTRGAQTINGCGATQAPLAFTADGGNGSAARAFLPKLMPDLGAPENDRIF
jgi:hypothetical protein